jgi:uncharacterized RDD family membrane protein YckC
MSEFPSYPKDASQREAEAVSEAPTRRLAGWWQRVAAQILDGILLALPLIVIAVIVAASGPGEDDDAAWGALAIVYLLSLLLPFIYFTVMHAGARGATFGKRAMGIKVVREDGGQLGYGKAFGRYGIVVVFWIFVLPALLDYLWPLWDDKNQALHDKVVGTLVVRD